MDQKEKFKLFVKKNPSLVKYVNNNKMTWQKFYEMYDLYGEDSDVWKEYLVATSSIDVLSFLKNINVDDIEENINSIKRVISVIQDLGVSKDTKQVYKPRPIYKHFED